MHSAELYDEVNDWWETSFSLLYQVLANPKYRPKRALLVKVQSFAKACSRSNAAIKRLSHAKAPSACRAWVAGRPTGL